MMSLGDMLGSEEIRLAELYGVNEIPIYVRTAEGLFEVDGVSRDRIITAMGLHDVIVIVAGKKK